MYVVRRKSDGWYYMGPGMISSFHPDIRQAQTYLAPPALWSKGVWVEQGAPLWEEAAFFSFKVVVAGALLAFTLYHLIKLHLPL